MLQGVKSSIVYIFVQAVNWILFLHHGYICEMDPCLHHASSCEHDLFLHHASICEIDPCLDLASRVNCVHV